MPGQRMTEEPPDRPSSHSPASVVGRVLPSVARIIAMIAGALLSAYLGLWFCCTILQDQGKGITDSSLVVCFFLNLFTLTGLARLLRARWWEALAPLPIPLAFAAVLSIMAGLGSDAIRIVLSCGLPIGLAAASTRLRLLRPTGQCLVMMAAILLCGCSKGKPKDARDPRPEILRCSGLGLPSRWVLEASDNWMDGLLVVRIKAPPQELREFCTSNGFVETTVPKADPFLQVTESDKILWKAGSDVPWEMQANAPQGRAIFLRSGPDKSGD